MVRPHEGTCPPEPVSRCSFVRVCARAGLGHPGTRPPVQRFDWPLPGAAHARPVAAQLVAHPHHLRATAARSPKEAHPRRHASGRGRWRERMLCDSLATPASSSNGHQRNPGIMNVNRQCLFPRAFHCPGTDGEDKLAAPQLRFFRRAGCTCRRACGHYVSVCVCGRVRTQHL